MAGFSKHLAQRIFDAVLNPAPVPLAIDTGSLWMSLHSAAPDDTTYGNEMYYSGYARALVQSLTATEAAVPPETTIVITNNADITFDPSTDTSEFTATHWAIWDTQEVGQGNILISGTIVPNRTIVSGDWVILPAGEFSFTLD